MKIAVFSDIHGNYQATKVILDDIKKNNYDKVICLGDIIGIGPKPKETLELILNNDIDIVLGNHELYYLKGIDIDKNIVEDSEKEHHRWIHECIKDIPKEKLNYPLSKEININGKKLVFQHYMLNSNDYPFESISIKDTEGLENYCENMTPDYMFVGHEHRPFEIHKNNKNIICVGSSGCVRDNKTFYTIIKIDDDIKITKKELEFDREGFINDLKSYKYPDQEFIFKNILGIEEL